MRSRRKTQTPILRHGILQRDPKPDRARRIRVQKRAVLMRGHPRPDLRLLADHHALQHARVAKPQRPCNGRVRRVQGRGAERRGELVQVMPDFVDGAVGRFQQSARGGGEGVLFEEKVDFVAAAEKVFVVDVGGGFARGELC